MANDVQEWMAIHNLSRPIAVERHEQNARGGPDRCHRQTPKKTLRLPNLSPVTEGTIFCAPNDPAGLSSMGVGSKWPGVQSTRTAVSASR